MDLSDYIDEMDTEEAQFWYDMGMLDEYYQVGEDVDEVNLNADSVGDIMDGSVI